MNTRNKIWSVFQLVREVAKSSESANKFVTKRLVEDLATLLTDILSIALEKGVPYPSLFETECKLYKSPNLKQRITTDLESVRSIIKEKISAKTSDMFEKILNSRSLPLDTSKKIADILVTILVEVDATYTLSNLRTIVAMLNKLKVTLTPHDAYMLYNKCTDQFVVMDKSSLAYIYKCLSEEMRQKEMEASSAKSLALCVFGVSTSEPYTRETVYSLLQHKGWEEFTSFIKNSPYQHTTQMAEQDVIDMCVNMADLTIIQLLRENAHQFRSVVITEAMDHIIKKFIKVPKAEYRDVVTQAYDLLVQITVLDNLA